MRKIKQLFKSVDSRRGGFSVGLTVIVIAILIVINMIVGKLPTSATQKDISATNIYTMSDVSKQITGNLTEDVKISVLADPSTVDERITTFVNKYAELSSHISVETVDTVLHPAILTQYSADDDSIVVSCDATGKTKTISFDSILEYDQMSYYYYGTKTYTDFDGEGQLTSAVAYVTSNQNSTVYVTSGHGEQSLPSAVTDLMTKSNIETTDLNLLTTTTIPDDCNLLLMYAPSTDITTDEATLLKSYLEGGGKVMLVLGAAQDTTPNINSVLTEYGLQMETGYVEDSSRCYQGHPYAVIPEVSASGTLATGLKSDSVLMYASMGMTQIDPARDSITVTPFMSTSAKASLTDANGTVLSSGTYVLGAYATESVGSSDTTSSDTTSTDTTGTARLTVISGYAMVDASITQSFSSLGNLTLFMNTVTANMNNTSSVSISSKSLQQQYNSVSHPGGYSLIFVLLIPVAVLALGFVIWMKRRKA